jgi:hypothetical protein
MIFNLLSLVLVLSKKFINLNLQLFSLLVLFLFLKVMLDSDFLVLFLLNKVELR